MDALDMFGSEKEEYTIQVWDYHSDPCIVTCPGVLIDSLQEAKTYVAGMYPHIKLQRCHRDLQTMATQACQEKQHLIVVLRDGEVALFSPMTP